MLLAHQIPELFAHLEWAESMVWTTALQSPTALGDHQIRNSLFHIHLTQRAFLNVWTGAPPLAYRELSFSTLEDLFAWSRPYYAEAGRFMKTVTEGSLHGPMPVPWASMFAERFGTMPQTPTLGETIYQVVAHSTYHRGQVNSRLRELGVEPPMVDYIAWIWFDRPAPNWPTA